MYKTSLTSLLLVVLAVLVATTLGQDIQPGEPCYDEQETYNACFLTNKDTCEAACSGATIEIDKPDATDSIEDVLKSICGLLEGAYCAIQSCCSPCASQSLALVTCQGGGGQEGGCTIDTKNCPDTSGSSRITTIVVALAGLAAVLM